MKPHVFLAASLLSFAAPLSAQTLPATKPATSAATKPDLHKLLRDKVDANRRYLAGARQLVQSDSTLASSPYLSMYLAVAQRFIDRVGDPAKPPKQPIQWSIAQMDEVKEVLDLATATINDARQGKTASWALGPVPTPTGGKVTIDNGLLVTEVVTPSDPNSRDATRRAPFTQPFFFGGYGHFDQLFKDLPDFPSLGVTAIQDGRIGPAQGLSEGFQLNSVAYRQWQDLKAAARANVKVDILPSPHYFPEWARQRWPEIVNGHVYQNIDHPRTREVHGRWLEGIARLYKDEPALMSYCLNNEPMYGAGADPYSRPLYLAFLQKRHGTIDKLNALYGTAYKSFDEVQGAPDQNTVQHRRAYFDWAQWNSRHFADWHGWQSEIIKKQDPDALTHVKIMVFFTLDADKFGTGIDPECFADVTDLAGCDAYSMPDYGIGPLDEPHDPKFWAYRWQAEELCYDLLNSFRNQPVFNSENHPIANGQGSGKYPGNQIRATLWQGALHHQAATTTWVWQDSFEPSLGDSIFFRPTGVAAHARALMDLNRLAGEVAAINRAPARFALLYSPACIYWQPGYREALRAAYVSLVMSGEKVTFVSDRMLAEGRAPKVDWIVLPQSTHVTDAATSALDKFTASGGRLLALGETPLAFDEYHRPRATLPPSLAKLPTIPMEADERAIADAIRQHLANSNYPLPALLVDNAPAWGVEFRVVPHDGKTLIPLTNLTRKTVTASLGVNATTATDLVSGQTVDPHRLELKPLEPFLLRID